jgi:hypothetical protein
LKTGRFSGRDIHENQMVNGGLPFCLEIKEYLIIIENNVYVEGGMRNGVYKKQ